MQATVCNVMSKERTKQIKICQPFYTSPPPSSSSSSSSPVCTGSLRFVQQQLHVREFLEALGTHGYETLSALQLLRRGHRHAVQSAQPERSKVTRKLNIKQTKRETTPVDWSLRAAHAQVCVYLRTAPVRSMAFSETSLRICSRFFRTLRGMMKRMAGLRTSPFLNTLHRDGVWVSMRVCREERT